MHKNCDEGPSEFINYIEEALKWILVNSIAVMKVVFCILSQANYPKNGANNATNTGNSKVTPCIKNKSRQAMKKQDPIQEAKALEKREILRHDVKQD